MVLPEDRRASAYGSRKVTVVDTSAERLAGPATLRPIGQVVGDGSSRLVLKQAGLEDADALVTATDSDEVNLEACRVALGQGIARVAAVAAQPERVGDFPWRARAQAVGLCLRFPGAARGK